MNIRIPEEKFNNKDDFFARRKQLRNGATPQEILLWAKLRNSALGYKFRRQHSIGNYILDFYCPSRRIAIELDGSQHQDTKEYDYIRDKFFCDFGIKVIRFWNNEINTNIEGVLMKIQEELGTTP